MILQHHLNAPDGAIFAGDNFRPLLWRTLDPVLVEPSDPWLLFIGCNPSKAGAHPSSDDATVRLLRGHARRAGFRRFLLVNVCDYIATHPKDMIAAGRPSSAENVSYVVAAIRLASRVVCCWGADVEGEITRAIEFRIVDEGKQPEALGLTQTGAPRHPRGIPTSARVMPLPLLRGMQPEEYRAWLVRA